MRYVPIALILLVVFPVIAQDSKPVLPKVPAGFDEGRKALLAELADKPIKAEDLLSRLFEDADLVTLSELVALHLEPGDKAKLDALLELKGELPRARDADGVLALLRGKELKPKMVIAALGKLAMAQKLSLTEMAAWLYARGYNFRVLQSAMNGERIDCLRIPAELRAARDKGAAALFTKGMWEFNLLDGREQAGGVYDGTQLVESLLALGWTGEDFARAVGKKTPAEIDAAFPELLKWGDPALIWKLLELKTPEAELAKKAAEHCRGMDDAAVLGAATRRIDAISRWFRTGGPGVVGVYEGPWPNAEGKPVPPVAAVREMKDGDTQWFASQLTAPVKGHFSAGTQTFVLVIYADGSGRAMLRPQGGSLVNYGAASPVGNQATRDKLYEGRVTLRGRGALMYSVFADGVTTAPTEFELVNVQLALEGKLLTADIDDGVNLTPILLRRTSRLVEAP